MFGKKKLELHVPAGCLGSNGKPKTNQQVSKWVGNWKQQLRIPVSASLGVNVSSRHTRRDMLVEICPEQQL